MRLTHVLCDRLGLSGRDDPGTARARVRLRDAWATVTAKYVAISTTLAGVRPVACPPVSAALIQTLGMRSVYLLAAVVMAVAIVLLSAAIRAAASSDASADDRSPVPALTSR